MENLLPRLCRQGQSLNEMSLVIGLVAVVAIGSLTVLGGEVSTMFSNMITTRPPGTGSPSTGGTTGPGTGPGSGTVNIPPGLIPFPDQPGQLMTFTYQGRPIQISLADSGSVLNESTGSNGLINQTRNGTLAIQQLIAQLEDVPEPPTEQIETLRRLAETSQKIGSLQQIVRDHLPPNFDNLTEGEKNAVLGSIKVDASSVLPGQTQIPLSSVMANLAYAYFTNTNSVYDSNLSCATVATRCNVTPNVVISQFMDDLSRFNVDAYADSTENPEKRASNEAMQKLVNDIFARMIFISAGKTADAQTPTNRDLLIQSTLTNTTNICNVGNVASCRSRG